MMGAIAFVLAIASQPVECGEQQPVDPPVTIAVAVVHSSELTSTEARALVADAAKTLAPLGIRLHTSSLRSMSGKVVGAPFLGAASSNSAGLAAMRASMAPIRAFTATYMTREHTSARASIAPSVTVWITPTIAPANARIRQLVRGRLVGMTLAPREKTFGAFAGLEGKTPLILLGTNDGANGHTLAHELGHAAGLSHVDDTNAGRARGALMRPQPDACPPVLDERERAKFGAFGAPSK